MKVMEGEEEENEERAGCLLCPFCTLYSTTVQPVVLSCSQHLPCWTGTCSKKAAPSEVMA